MPRKVLIDMAGSRHGRLVGLRFSHRGPHGHAHWLFSCDCGAELTVDGSKVRSGNTTSCGCRHREISAARLTTHGQRAERRHGGTYRAWQAMKDACRNPASPKYEAAGARGVGIDPAWEDDFERFFRDMGERPAGTTLARRDGAGHFSPGNCVWTATPSRSVRAARGWEKRRSAGDAAPRSGPPASARRVAARAAEASAQPNRSA